MSKRSVIYIVYIIIVLGAVLMTDINITSRRFLILPELGLIFFATLMGFHIRNLMVRNGDARSIKDLRGIDGPHPLRAIGCGFDKYLVVVQVLVWNKCSYFEVPISWVRDIYECRNGDQRILVTNSHGNTYVDLYLKPSTLDSLEYLPVRRDLIQTA